MANDDWNWQTAREEGHVVIPPVQAIAVYTNVNGDVVIRQRGEYGEDDSIIAVPVGALESLIEALVIEGKVDKPE